MLRQAIFSILDHSLRRNADQERVIGTLLGTRSEDGGEVEVRSAFAVGHSEAEDQVEVDMEYHKQMLALHLKANPREVLVGWYATASELNTFSALIQNFYSGQGDGTWPHPAVHLTVSTEAGKDLETRAYISAPVGVTAERAADSAAFIPVPYELRYGEADKSGLEVIANAKDAEDRSTTVMSDVEALERAIEEVLAMIDRVSRYVESVIDEEAPASTAMGQFLLNALALAPKVEPADIERDLYVSSYVPRPFDGGSFTDFSQQQPHPGRPGRLLPGQHYSHTDGAVQPASNRPTHSRRRRGHWYLRRGPAQPARRQGWPPAAPGARCPRGGPRIKGYNDGKMMHEVTNFPVEPQFSSLMFVTSRSLPYFHIMVRFLLCLYLPFFLFLFLISFAPPHPYSLPFCETGQKTFEHTSSALSHFPAFLSFHGLSEVLAALVRKSKSTVAYQSRSRFSSDRVDCLGNGGGGVLHDKQIWPAAEDMLRSRILRAPWTRSHEVASYLGAAFSYDEMDIKMLEPEYCFVID